MKQIEFTQAVESSNFWPTLDDNGNPQIDVETGGAAGSFVITKAQPGQQLVCPDHMANKLIGLGYAVAV